jgi:hypothetical protein
MQENKKMSLTHFENPFKVTENKDQPKFLKKNTSPMHNLYLAY